MFPVNSTELSSGNVAAYQMVQMKSKSICSPKHHGWMIWLIAWANRPCLNHSSHSIAQSKSLTHRLLSQNCPASVGACVMRFNRRPWTTNFWFDGSWKRLWRGAKPGQVMISATAAASVGVGMVLAIWSSCPVTWYTTTAVELESSPRLRALPLAEPLLRGGLVGDNRRRHVNWKITGGYKSFVM